MSECSHIVSSDNNNIFPCYRGFPADSHGFCLGDIPQCSALRSKHIISPMSTD